MDSDPSSESSSQPTQLLQHALASAPQSRQHSMGFVLDSPKDDGDFSLDSRVIPARSATPRYHLPLQSPIQSSVDEHVLVAEQLAVPSVGAGSGSESFPLAGGPASISKVIAKSTASFHFPPSTRPLSRPKSMPIGSKHYHRSPSFPSQDSFGGPISQDPAEQYLASAKQFDVPLSDLGETPTQEIIHSPTDPELTLPDASEHREFFEAAMREYEAQRAKRHTSNHRPNVLVVTTRRNSCEFSGPPQQKDDDVPGQESRFEFSGSSSFDKMLERGLVDALDPTSGPSQASKVEPLQPDSLTDVEDCTKDNSPITSPRRSEKCSPSPSFEWIAPIPSAVVASSNPNSLLRMVHPGNQYRIAKMLNLARKVEPRSCLTTGTEMQPSHMEETQPCYTTGSINPNTLLPIRPTPRPVRSTRSSRYLPRGDEKLEDIIPDSESLQAGPSSLSHSLGQVVTQGPLKKPLLPLSPISEGRSRHIVPDSVELEESEADVPLAIEAASRNMTLHGRKTRIVSSALSTKVPTPAPEKQPQRPMSSTAGKNKMDLEVPTSLPEQDLQGQAFYFRQPHATTSSVSPPRKRRKGTESLEPSRELSASMKPVADNKHSRKSDTRSLEGPARQSTEGEEATHHGVSGEEGKTESADGRCTRSPPSPPQKLNMSRKKRRRTDDASPAQEMDTSKVPTSTRSKLSGTPAVATRSTRRPRSGLSSVRGLNTDPTRVFALWKLDGHYYSGVVYSSGLKNSYSVRFDDGSSDDVELKNMRRRELRVGDGVINVHDDAMVVVRDVSRAEQGSIILEADDGKEITSHTLSFKDIRVANRSIQSRWKDRKIEAESIVTVVRPKSVINSTSSSQTIPSAITSKILPGLVKTGFVVTINPKNKDPTQTKDEAMRAIRQHGGQVIEDWSSVFAMEGKHSQSNKRWCAMPQDFRWKSEANLDRVFLLSDDAHQKPKFLLALALGIPCLSFEWLTREGEVPSDWQPFLLPAGYSDTLGARISQLVDLDWGNCTEYLTDIMENQVPMKLFSQKTVLCVGTELVPLPPNRAKKNNNAEEASRYVPWIILCMGAAKVEAISDTKQMSIAHMKSFDYIVVKKRDVLGSLELDGVVVGDVNWVKDCLVLSRLSLPKWD